MFPFVMADAQNPASNRGPSLRQMILAPDPFPSISIYVRVVFRGMFSYVKPCKSLSSKKITVAFYFLEKSIAIQMHSDLSYTVHL